LLILNLIHYLSTSQLKNKHTMIPSNKLTAQLRILILNYVIREDYYPNDWFNLNEIEQDFLNDKISYQEYDESVKKLLLDWK